MDDQPLWPIEGDEEELWRELQPSGEDELVQEEDRPTNNTSEANDVEEQLLDNGESQELSVARESLERPDCHEPQMRGNNFTLEKEDSGPNHNCVNPVKHRERDKDTEQSDSPRHILLEDNATTFDQLLDSAVINNSIRKPLKSEFNEGLISDGISFTESKQLSDKTAQNESIPDQNCLNPCKIRVNEDITCPTAEKERRKEDGNELNNSPRHCVSGEPAELRDRAAEPMDGLLQQLREQQRQFAAQLSEQAMWRRDKEALVMRYAVSEQKNIELQGKLTKLEQRARDWMRERDTVVSKMKVTKAEQLKMTEQLEHRAVEIVSLRREIEKFKDTVSGLETNVKYHQSKGKVEFEAHKETKLKLEESRLKLKSVKEESEAVKRNAEAVIEKQREVELMKTITKELQLKETEQELLTRKQEHSDHEEVFQRMRAELDLLKNQQKDLVVELSTYKDKVMCLESERLLQERTHSLLQDTLQKQKKENREQGDRIAQLADCGDTALQVSTELAAAQQLCADLQLANQELGGELESAAQREGTHVVDARRLSDEIVRLQSERIDHVSQISTLTADTKRLKLKLDDVSAKAICLEVKLSEAVKQRVDHAALIDDKLDQQTRLVQELTKRCEEKEDEIKTCKRRHLANSKDLMRQLAALQKHLEATHDYPRSQNGSPLFQFGEPRPSDIPNVGSPEVNGGARALSGAGGGASVPGGKGGGVVPAEWEALDKRVLVEKILRLQAAAARQNEKLEFMQEHNESLLSQLLLCNADGR